MSANIGRKVVRVSKTDFELDNGAVYPHLVPLDVVPSVQDFQKTYGQPQGWLSRFGAAGIKQEICQS